MSHKLEVLADYREALLLAEVAAWLHDIGKLSQEFIDSHATVESSQNTKWHHELVLRRHIRQVEQRLGVDISSATKDDLRRLVEKITGETIPTQTKSRAFPNPKKSDFVGKLGNYLQHLGLGHHVNTVREFFAYFEQEARISHDFFPDKFIDFVEDSRFALLGEEVCIADYIEQHGDPVQPDGNLIKLFKPPGCDGIDSAMDKGNANAPQREDVYIATAFGFESQRIRHLTLWRKAFACSSQSLNSNRRSRKSVIMRVYKHALGETRRAANDVTLWDHSCSVGVLYRTLLARILLITNSLPDLEYFVNGASNRWDAKVWRLLSIRTDGLHYLLSAPSIPDILARKALLSDAWNKIQHLLEETYPLGLEVYRDENGSLFVVPDVENIELELVDTATGKNLRQLILEAFDQGTVHDDSRLRVEGEIIPNLHADSQPWNGRPPDGLPPVGEHLQRKIESTSDAAVIADAWCGRREQICTVCGLRPQGPNGKAKERGVCDVCEQRRADRAKEWAACKLDTTIWTNEVADVNGRLALLVGQFDLKHWLDGSLVRTLAVREPNDENGHTDDKVAKNPSFARLRRIWETTKRFWEEIRDGLGESVGQAGPRLKIRGELRQRDSDDTPGPYHAYELVVENVRVSVVWDDGYERFITAENLAYIEGPTQLGRPLASVLEAGGTFVIEEPTGYGAVNKEWGTITLDREGVSSLPPGYTPAIPILTEPRTFMALVPADRALDVVRAIKTRYEREMGKVRNRLPLHLGLVYAHRRAPLRAMLDAGRRMLKQKIPRPVDEWCVAEDVVPQPSPLPEGVGDLADDSQQFAKWYAVQLENRTLNRSLTWYVPATMGDGETEDRWYPYVFLRREENDEPADRECYFQALNPFDLDGNGNPRPDWLVHVCRLQQGDTIYFTPATLDFIWLDSSARRFEIAYDEQGCRRRLPRRPYLLDELETLKEIWQTLSENLATVQIHTLNALIESKRAAWQTAPTNETLRQFCRDALASAKWQSQPWGGDRDGWLNTWADYAARGWLADAVELYHHVMKQSGQPDAESPIR